MITQLQHLNRLSAKDIMKTKLFTAKAGQNLNTVEILAEIRHVRHIPVVDDDNHLIGMLSTRNFLEHLSVGNASHFVDVASLMGKRLIFAPTSTTVTEVAKLMKKHNISAIPIVEDKTLVGIISERDFVDLFINLAT